MTANRVRVGMVGTGGIGRVHLANLTKIDQAQLVAVCDVNEASVAEICETYGITGYTDYEAMLAAERLDALFICVPPFAQGTLVEQAAARGIHLLVEKPIGLAMEEVERKLKAIQDAQILASTGYCLRYLDIVAQAKAYVADKTIAMVRGHYLTSFVQTPWWREQAKSGGQLVEQATHTLDMMRYLAGDVSKVYAHAALRVMGDVPGLDIPDVTSVSLAFSSGAIGTLDTTFTQPDHRTGVEVLGKGFRLQISGRDLTIVDAEGTRTYSSTLDFYLAQDEAFIRAVATGDETLILAPYAQALQTLKVTLAANESAKSGSPVKL
ncbi:Gfo/Idh/MocA family protein [Brevibacillus fluminis]|uniref:Gfo/Idh/MocA family protein n=1 Tax=Brevibacillus fluminis TaxID=511487 RepID=UPI003F88F423